MTEGARPQPRMLDRIFIGCCPVAVLGVVGPRLSIYRLIPPVSSARYAAVRRSTSETGSA